MSVKAEFPAKLQFLFQPKRYKIAYGGRGGTKSWGYARALLILGAQKTLRILCARETQKSIADSVYKLLVDQIEALQLQYFYRVTKTSIVGANGTEFTFAGIRQSSVGDIKSYEGCDICWVEEAQIVSKRSWDILIPTIRKDGSEIWVSFNPDLDSDDTYKRFVTSPPSDAYVVKVNWRDNPWFPEVLRKEMLDLKSKSQEDYEHVYEGTCKQVVEGAIYRKELIEAEKMNRICRVPYDAMKPVDTFWDLGFGDNVSIWFAQSVGFEFRIIDFMSDCLKDLSFYLKALHAKPYLYGNDYLPHDARAKTLAAGGRSVQQIMTAGGRKVQIVRQLSVVDGIAAARTIFNKCYFDSEKCADGIQALRHYRYDYDEDLMTFKKEPRHDWACFDFNTLVLTRYGTCRIIDLPKNGEVLTPCGWKRYEGPKVTKRNASLVEVEFTDGSTVRCTPEHLFLTDSGWKSAESLELNTEIQSSLTKSRNISMAVCTAYGQAMSIIQGAASGCIALFGRVLSALFPQNATSITEMETQAVMVLSTSNVCQQESTWPLLGGLLQLAPSASLPGSRLLSGTDRKLADYGTVGTPSDLRVGRNGSEKLGTVLNAISNSVRWLGSLVTRKNTAPSYAKSLRIASVKHLSDKADVCCIHVEEGHWFSLANGAVVHNSHPADAFRYLAVSIRESITAKPKILNNRPSASAWS